MGEARRSAVLILFGALDNIDAQSDAGTVPGDLDVLLTRRSDRMRHHPGQIAFPGGGIDATDADAAAAAVREAHEETGLDPAGVDVLGALPEIYMPVSNNLVTPVIAWWRETSPVQPDEQESHEVMRVPVAELLDPAARGTSELRHQGMTYRGAAFKLGPQFGGHIVWGFTGMLLSSILDGVGWSQPWSRSTVFEVAAIRPVR